MRGGITEVTLSQRHQWWRGVECRWKANARDGVAVALGHHGNSNCNDEGVIWLLLATRGACREEGRLTR